MKAGERLLNKVVLIGKGLREEELLQGLQDTLDDSRKQ